MIAATIGGAMACNFIAEVKERGEGQPCYLLLNLKDDAEFGGKFPYLDMPEGTGLAEARALRYSLHVSGAKLRLL